MSHLFPSSGGSSMCPSYSVGGKISDKNLEQRINIKFCVKIGNIASEMLALLTVAYGEYAMMILNGTGSSGKGKDVQDDRRYGQPKTQMLQMWTEYEPWCVHIKG
jgi:hypothetical protein